MLGEGGAQNIQAHLEIGIPDTAIIVLAEELVARLIVMGSRGLGVYGEPCWEASRIR